LDGLSEKVMKQPSQVLKTQIKLKLNKNRAMNISSGLKKKSKAEAKNLVKGVYVQGTMQPEHKITKDILDTSS